MKSRIFALALAVTSMPYISLFAADGKSPIKIDLTVTPPAGRGGENLLPIAGTVSGAPPGSVVIIWAKSDQNTLWVQPWANAYRTRITPDQTFSTVTHPGLEYSIAICNPTFSSPMTRGSLPSVGGGVLALATFKGK